MATKPNFKPQRDLPLTPISYWGEVAFVKRALDDLERGYFRLAAHLVDAMFRDDRISGAMATRVNGVLGQPLEMDGGDDPPAPVVKLGEELEKNWPSMFPEADLEDVVRWGIMLGIGTGEMLWKTRPDRWVPRLKVWHPSMAYWAWGPRNYKLITEDGQVDLSDPTDEGDGNWLVFTPYGYQRGWMRGAVRSLALPWLIRGWARRDWARHSEVHGSPVKKGWVPQNATVEDRDKFIEAISQLGAEGVIECVTLPDGTKFDIDLVEAKAQTWEGFRELLGHAETAISIVLLGQNLTTEVKQGSRAAAQVHDGVRKDFQQADARKLGRSVQVQVLRPYAGFNLGNPDLAPFPAWQTEPPEDEIQRADALQKVGGFLTSAKTAGVEDVDQRALLDSFGIPLLTPAQVEQQKQDAAERAVAAQEAFKQRSAAEPGQDDEEPEDEESEEQLADKPKRKLPKGARQGQAYADRLVAAAVGQGADALGTTLTRLRSVIDQATSPQDLRERLVEAFAHLSAGEFQTLVERAHIMAELMGRTAVLSDL